MMEIFAYIGVAFAIMVGISLAVGVLVCSFFGAMMLLNYRK